MLCQRHIHTRVKSEAAHCLGAQKTNLKMPRQILCTCFSVKTPTNCQLTNTNEISKKRGDEEMAKQDNHFINQRLC